MKVPFCKPVFDNAMAQAAQRALTTEFFVGGDSVAKFEEAFAGYCGVDYAVAVSSGTHALQFAMLALGIGAGDKVITTPMTFIATANAVLHAGATPVFCDINDQCGLDPAVLEDKLDEDVKGIMPVHLYGRPCEMDELMVVAEKHKLFVIEDACQAHGAEYKGRKAGSIGDVGCFSFYSTKNLTVCGDGGMVVTDDEHIAAHVRKLRNCGRKSQYEHDMLGYTSRLNTVNAAIGLEQLKYLDEWIAKRRRNAELYRRLLQDVPCIELLPPERDTKSVYHLFAIRSKRRDALKDFLAQNGIGCGTHYPVPVHLQPLYKELYVYKGGEFPRAESHANDVLTLPMFPCLKAEEIKYVCSKIEGYLETADGDRTTGPTKRRP